MVVYHPVDCQKSLPPLGLGSSVVSAGWQLTIYAFPPGQVLSYCRAGAMGVILGVVDNTVVVKKQKNLLS